MSYNITLHQRSITSPKHFKNQSPAPSSFLFSSQPQLTPPIVCGLGPCSRVGDCDLSGYLSLSCSDCLSTALRLCSISGTKTLKWNGMSENPGCLYNKEHVASLGNNEARWIAIQFFVVLPALDKAKIWPTLRVAISFVASTGMVNYFAVLQEATMSQLLPLHPHQKQNWQIALHRWNRWLLTGLTKRT